MLSRKFKRLAVVVILRLTMQIINKILLIILVVITIRAVVEREVTEIIKVVVLIIGLKTTVIISRINEKMMHKVGVLTELMSNNLIVTSLVILITQL